MAVNLYLPGKGKVYLRGLSLVEDPAPFKPIPKDAAMVFERLRNLHESPVTKDLLNKNPIDATDRAILNADLAEYNFDVNNQLEILKELLRDTVAESLLAESMNIAEEARAIRAKPRKAS
ncbi:MAG: hypothetical protein ACKO2G_14065 [Verrucomicrobiales bacterium]